MKTVKLPSGESVAALGLGTWRYGEERSRRAQEIATLSAALDAGATLIDTAEMYGEGAAEALIGEALAGRRDAAFIVSKVYPHNATRKGTQAACERSLKRLKTDRIDLYLLHWRQSTPLEESVEALAALERGGKIRHWGVSNLDLSDMHELWDLPEGRGVQTNQLLYNLSRRGIEWDLLPWLRERRVPVMAYSPIEQARLVRHRGLADFARRHGATPAQAALAWLLAKDGVIVIPKTSRVERLKENLGAMELRLSKEQLAELDLLFPPPKGPKPLEML
ncbi:MAG TPA: aldo/keto reductase [Burkholderiales bacterium]|nr:aldo/keto reductase [Burkholderiales bacterium]